MPIEIGRRCKFCQSDQLRQFTATERMLGLGGEFLYSECLACSSIQLEESLEDFSSFYPENYYSFSPLSLSSFPVRVLKKLRMRIFLWTGLKKIAPIYGYWLKKINPKFSHKIADVGCGNGQLLYELEASGFKNLHGFDPYIQETKVISTSLKLWKKRIEDSDLTFDLIMMHHSFEHMKDPMAVLKNCYEKLNPGGKLLIRCPVADSEIWKTKGILWVQLDAPRHLIIPSLSGMKKLAEKVDFFLTEIEFDSTDFQFWGTKLYENGEKLEQGKIRLYCSQAERADQMKKAVQYNEEGKGDQACFYLVKIDPS